MSRTDTQTGLLDPLRLTTAEVCARARISRATLWRRVADGRLPRPVDYARQALFSAESVERALIEAVVLQPTALDLAIARKVAARQARFHQGLISDL